MNEFVIVKNEKDCIKLLTYLFHKGWKWAGGNKSPHHTNFIPEEGVIIYHVWDDMTVQCHNDAHDIRICMRYETPITIEEFWKKSRSRFETFIEVDDED